jgi:hypothetical protein
MMETALEIHDRNYTMDFPFTLFCKIAKQRFLKIKPTTSIDTDIPEQPSEYQIDTTLILDLLAQPPRSKRQFVTNEIFKLYLKFGTEQAVSDYTGIKRTTIHSQIQKFKNYARKNINID